MIFEDKPFVKVTAVVENTTNTISIDGITANAFTPEQAKTNLDILLNIVGKSVTTNKMKRIRTEEASDNE